MECMNKCGREAKVNSKYCSNSCRATFSRRSAQRSAGAAQQAETGAAPIRATTLTDACGNVHKIDYEGRSADVKLLESWCRGEGTEYQLPAGPVLVGAKMNQSDTPFNRRPGGMARWGREVLSLYATRSSIRAIFRKLDCRNFSEHKFETMLR